MEGANQPHALLQSDFRHCSEVVEQDCGLPFEEGGYFGQFGGGAFPVGDIPLEHHPSRAHGEVHAARRRGSVRLGPATISVTRCKING